MEFYSSDYCDVVQPIKLKWHQQIYIKLKRVVDCCFAAVLCVVLFLPCVFVAVAIKLDSKGPILFKQKRIGKNRVPFVCYKFRTMYMDANHNIAGYNYADVYLQITRVGHFLRRTSLDEIPQLLCVITGKMSLIGYRPSQECETELNTVREGFDIYQIRPGITGWAQINGRDILAAIPELKARYDGYYLKNIGICLDIKIILKTFKNVLKQNDINEGVLSEYGHFYFPSYKQSSSINIDSKFRKK